MVTLTVLFVHGTGVREPDYSDALRRIRNGLAKLRPDVRVEPCDWGSALGSHLRAGGVSIPGFVEQGGRGPDEPDPRDQAIAQWALLYINPFAELELAALAAPADPGGFVPGVVPPGDALLSALAGLPADDTVRAAWERSGIGVPLTEAVAALAAAPALRRATERDPHALPRLTARALVAYALGRGETPIVAAAERDALTELLTDALGGDVRGVPEAVAAAARLSARLFESLGGSRVVVARRTAWSERKVGFFGDIVRYLVRGEAVRALVAERVRAQPGPVVLLGHSLGGIVCFDLLASGVLLDGAEQGPGARPAEVAGLLTVGSQAPLLHELDALPSLRFGTSLPPGFPPWVNVYDRRDMLAFLAAEVFRPAGADVLDVAVDNSEPVSAAHGAYWDNQHVHQVMCELLDRVAPP
ncbi:hypothetical protein BN159_5776 [Streptomyces davaonensis JCM 4913]|uniref:AB hydrolase-1 domain-containing protein n=1 Tax=Streptomyces davaonensis (strain DSM 101723 / JCM 4913 / KCC S-0913 / 768) TaxID=1214101 RepID=K4RAH2_STRDJ|nr:alpha/beta fold hydrolase [Streptomyces davaonensis]CCK30155.1 hypothetical protein BN159_5776 [Streptomyces davaonensis JCM 4913]